MKNMNLSRKKMSEIREFHSASFGIFFKVSKRLYHKKSKFQKIEVFSNNTFGKVLVLDGLIQTTEKDEYFYHETLVHPALVCHPGPRDVLIIGGGDGGALREVLRYPVKKAWLVEIDSQVIDVAKKYFAWLRPALKDKRAKLVIDDGYKFIQETEQKFDIILVDSSDPVGPSICLHERDFYENVKKCLKPGGIITAQAGSPLYYLQSFRETNKFLKELFKFACFYLGPVPTYPGGLWGYVYLSDKIHPLKGQKKEPPAGLKYYNLDVHRAAFALPEFLRKKLI